MPIFAHLNLSLLTMPTLSAISPVITNLLIGLFLCISIVMILLVLIQRPQGGGLSGAFGAGGGGGAGQTAFGTKTGDVLTWATIGIFVAFVGFAIVLNFATRPPKPTANQSQVAAPGGASTPAPEGEDGEAFDLSADPLDMLGDQTDEPTDTSADDAPSADPGADIPADGG